MVNSNEMKTNKMTKRSSFGGVVRRTLSDITNSVSLQTKSLNPEKTALPSDQSIKEYIDHLVKENMALGRLVADKNKIIELTGTELHKLRLDLQKMQINLQKMRLQNLNLAQSNSHMLVELNIGKEKLKVLQHETACKDAVLKAKNEELKAKSKNENNQKNLSQKEQDAVGEQISHGNTNVQKTRRGKTSSKSMGSITTAQPVAEKEVSENKRRCLRRQSARVRSQEQEPDENLFEIGDAQFLAGPAVDYPLSKVSSNSFARKEEEKENCGTNSDALQSRRSSMGRPSRRAAVKVQSYKEVPLNIKMRRSE